MTTKYGERPGVEASSTVSRAPSVRQMVVRANGYHYDLLRAAAEQRTLPFSFALQTAGATLRRWGCLDAWNITERGEQLLLALNAQERASAQARQHAQSLAVETASVIDAALAKARGEVQP